LPPKIELGSRLHIPRVFARTPNGSIATTVICVIRRRPIAALLVLSMNTAKQIIQILQKGMTAGGVMHQVVR